jgi:L-Ala-D/L-Glu epimerase
MHPTTIVDFRFTPLNVELLEPFGISTGAQHVARNVLVEIELANGTVGIGEAAPFEAVSGETQSGVLTCFGDAGVLLLGRDVREFRRLSAMLWEAWSAVPTAIAGVEIAVFDALTRSIGISLLDWFGRAQRQLQTDITITTATSDDPLGAAANAARRAAALGFRTLKIKVGKEPLDVEVARLVAIAQAAPNVRFVLDANAGYTASRAIELLAALGEPKARVDAFEQPVARDDWDGLLEVQRKTGVAVYADESLRGFDDWARLVKQGGPSGLNIKTAKLGLVRAWDIAQSARSLDFALMIGGMVETELSMSCSACLAAGLGGFSHVDLDTPLFMKERPLAGGYRQDGPCLDLSGVHVGHGVSYLPPVARSS